MRARAAALALAAAALAAIGGPVGASAQDAPHTSARTPLQHVVLVTQDHRSFDHYFGTRPGVDGVPANTCLPTGAGLPCVPPFHLTSTTVLAPFNDGRSYLEAQLDGGKMDGFVSAYADTAADGRQTMGYYDGSDLPYYWQLADEFVLFDHYHAALPTNGVANRYFAVTGAPPPQGVTSVPANGWPSVPTIFDRLTAAGVSWKVYVENYGQPNPTDAQLARFRARVPLLGLETNPDASALSGHVVGLSQYYTDAAQDTLPSVSLVVATGPTERPPAAPTAGMRFVRGLVTSLQTSRAWSSSALLLDYDSSGGWYDHVPPPPAEGQARGARVPALLVSPFARPGTVDSDVMDSAAGLRLLEENWGLAALTTRDATSPSILSVLDFGLQRHAQLTAVRDDVRTPVQQTLGIYLMYGLVLATAGLLAYRLGLRSSPVTPTASPDQAPVI